MKKALTFLIAIALTTTLFAQQDEAWYKKKKKAGFIVVGGVSWTLIQHLTNFTCAGTAGVGAKSCSVTASVTSGDLLVLVSGSFVEAQVSVPPAFGSATGDSFIHCPSQLANEQYATNTYESVDCAYILSATGGTATFAFAWQYNSSSGSYDIDVGLYEYRRSTGTATYETCGAGGATACVATSGSCAPCTGPTPTVTGTDVVIVANANENDCTAVGSPFNVSPSPDVDNSNVFGIFAWSLSQTSGVPAVYTCSAGGAAMMALAFK